jgi:PAS domain S-box-containing protein
MNGDNLKDVVDSQASEILRLQKELKELRKLQDVRSSELRQAKQAHKDLYERIRTLIENFPLGLVVVDVRQRIEAANLKALEYFQFSLDELVGMPISTLFPQAGALEPKPQPYKLMGRRKSGETFAVEVAVNVLGFAGKERLFINVQDITTRFQLEQLRLELIGMVSHDLRTPLTAIRVTLEMVQAGVFGGISERGTRSVSRAVQSVEYLCSLVVNLLDAEKIESGDIKLTYKKTSVEAVVAKALASIPRDQLSVSIETVVKDDTMVVDPDRLVQVLINLISNAIKYSPPGGTITVVAGRDGQSIRFQVSDQGPGIPEAMQSIVFERYRQLDQPSGIKRQGFGLGLAICRALVEKHKGRIWVDSEIGKGSSFSFLIPISQ